MKYSSNIVFYLSYASSFERCTNEIVTTILSTFLESPPSSVLKECTEYRRISSNAQSSEFLKMKLRRQFQVVYSSYKTCDIIWWQYILIIYRSSPKDPKSNNIEQFSSAFDKKYWQRSTLKRYRAEGVKALPGVRRFPKWYTNVPLALFVQRKQGVSLSVSRVLLLYDRRKVFFILQQWFA